MNRFWNWANVKDEGEGNVRVLRMEGAIAEESWFDDAVTPKAFRDELMDGDGDIELYINSPGGDCIAASQIYTMLMDYPGNVTVKIDGIAASAASVISMAGSKVMMSPTAIMMIHDPMTCAMGNTDDMRQAISLLEEVKESIINAYEIKTGLSRARISHLMSNETWMNANKAIELGFCDEIMYTDAQRAESETLKNSFSFSRHSVDLAIANRIRTAKENETDSVTGTVTADGVVIGDPIAENTVTADYVCGSCDATVYDASKDDIGKIHADDETEEKEAKADGVSVDEMYGRLMSKKYI